MNERFSRTEALIGEAALQKLKASRVAVFGIGGVGGYVVEALARSGVGEMHLIDADTVSISNMNRQIIATEETLGKYKTYAARERILSINPKARVICHNMFFSEETEGQLDFRSYDYIVDAIDSVTSKIRLVIKAQESGTPIISSMGTGNKLDPCRFEITDIYKTSVCPLARVMRTELRRRGVKSLKVLYSREEPIKASIEGDENTQKNRHAPASIAFVPSVGGLIIASEVIKDLIK